MPNQVTVTGKTGPGSTATAQLFTDLTNVNVDFSKQTLTVVQTGNRITTFDLYGIATVTYTIASHVATLAFS
jgi:hypothetical protein